MTAHYSLGNSILCVDYQISAKELLQTVFYLLFKYVQCALYIANKEIHTIN